LNELESRGVCGDAAMGVLLFEPRVAGQSLSGGINASEPGLIHAGYAEYMVENVFSPS
jgi:hypothetical protein